MSTKKVDAIFVINTGRSGSDYLYNLFNVHPGCKAFHETFPVGAFSALRKYQRGNPQEMLGIAKEKTRLIDLHTKQGLCYVETNHCFIKGFGWELPTLNPHNHFGIIILTRDSEQIVQSTLRIGCSPLRKYGRDWILSPNKLHPLVKPPGGIAARLLYNFTRIYHLLFRALPNRLGFKEFTPMWLRRYEEKAVHWYFQETHALADAYQSKYPNFTYYKVDITELNTEAGVTKLFQAFGLNSDDAMNEFVGKATNLKNTDVSRG